MSTKQKGDIAEQAAILYALKRGWGVLKPIGDNLPYDLVLDVDGSLLRMQVKSAWIDKHGNHIVDNRRPKTNRRRILKKTYQLGDFDYALAYLQEYDLFYVFPIGVFVGYAGAISMVEDSKRQRKPKSAIYRDAWHLILDGSNSGKQSKDKVLEI